jgi:HK97 gp10 family phage protein
MFTSFLDQFKANVVDPAVDARMNAAGAAWQAEAQRLCPVDTGQLRASIGYSYDAQNKRLSLYADAPHALFCELGTSRMPARPYMRPALRVIPAAFRSGVTVQAAGTPERYVERIHKYTRGRIGGKLGNRVGGHKLRVGRGRYR